MAKKVTLPKAVVDSSRRRTLAGAERVLEENSDAYMRFRESQAALDATADQQIAAWSKLKQRNLSINK